MSTTEIILLSVYIIGIPIWMLVEKKWLPYEEGEYTIEFDGAHEITPEMHRDNAIARSVIWPFCLAALVLLSPIVLLNKLAEKCGL